ncbi:YolD-like family protein [Salimicrobium halophilum]|uniref:YolD-like protein n=1 Tax=Salimicrobium halophilum TaxID=86666 RepID=A0A1G8W9S1_9BACI|nr:YolD-like family protein [Salimicrobium halophilum]SDJ75018.1 YolD-like protein [Salimicrobium halophilum]
MKQEPKDRGSIKWTSLMLPEHVDMLRNLWKEDERVERGWMEEQQAAGIDFVLKHAVNEKQPVQVKVHNGFDFEIHEVIPLRLHKQKQTLECRALNREETYELAWSDITDVTI